MSSGQASLSPAAFGAHLEPSFEQFIQTQHASAPTPNVAPTGLIAFKDFINPSMMTPTSYGSYEYAHLHHIEGRLALSSEKRDFQSLEEESTLEEIEKGKGKAPIIPTQPNNPEPPCKRMRFQDSSDEESCVVALNEELSADQETARVEAPVKHLGEDQAKADSEPYEQPLSDSFAGDINAHFLFADPATIAEQALAFLRMSIPAEPKFTFTPTEEDFDFFD